MAAGSRRVAIAVSALFVYLGLFVFGFSMAAAVGLFGDSSRQRIEDGAFALLGLGVLWAARTRLLRLGGSPTRSRRR